MKKRLLAPLLLLSATLVFPLTTHAQTTNSFCTVETEEYSNGNVRVELSYFRTSAEQGYEPDIIMETSDGVGGIVPISQRTCRQNQADPSVIICNFVVLQEQLIHDTSWTFSGLTQSGSRVCTGSTTLTGNSTSNDVFSPDETGDTSSGNSNSGGTNAGGLDNFQGVTDGVLDDLNPIKLFGDENETGDLSTPGGILSRVLVFAFPLAGLILFVMILWGGFEMLSGSATKKSLDAGRQRVTAALIGFILLFVSYWIIQVLEVIFGIIIFV